MRDQNIVRLVPILVVLAVIVVGTVVARRRGYNVGGQTVVRCRDGHLFTTVWIPGGSFKSIRLGWYRLQYCPVGRHWSLVAPVRDEDLTDAERGFAHAHHDTRVP
ncbi:hypothetical protein [Pseudofrankia inefficax]|uniref:Uncharacterized protein n=1 Tax=Pseudofrankia inefficax (strain DSM 45817 / CECT 9037 / DDB 130130 / EuI1c) TaxID=298654 RepID=E3J4G0_PSEI1|nr:hypothetical protein [Pseudofrankia inefficax]ADP83079.1 hypothetical protein FraEuI1c_5090 [Pseudofrankia inefficax]